MATNVYFSQKVRSEQHLYEDIVIESLKMYGQDVYYLPRDVAHIDTILSEDVEAEYDSAYVVEMYIENTEGFEGEGDILSKFGVEVRDQATFIVSRRRWEQLIGIHNNGINSVRPNEGDLIYLPLANSIFEIRFVEDEMPFYQLSNLAVYKLQCELYEYQGEKFDTGVGALDNLIDKTVAAQIILDVGITNGLEFTVGETVQQELSEAGEYVQGQVVAIAELGATRRLSLSDWVTTDGKYHIFSEQASITGVDSGTIATIQDVLEITDSTLTTAFPNDPLAQNQEIQKAAEDIIDFSETNPFGDIV